MSLKTIANYTAVTTAKLRTPYDKSKQTNVVASQRVVKTSLRRGHLFLH